MEPQSGGIPVERVPDAFYRDFLTLAIDVEYLKAEVANLRAKKQQATKKKSRRTKKARKPAK